MEKFTQKYTIVQFLEPVEVGYEYAASDWPLHATLADIFAVDWQDGALLRQLEQLVAQHHTFTTAAGDYDYFGPNRDVKVTLIDMSDQLVALHRDIIALLQSAGASFNTPQYINNGFKAHSTVRPHASIEPGDAVTFDQLSLIDMFPEEDPYRRRVLSRFALRQ